MRHATYFRIRDFSVAVRKGAEIKLLYQFSIAKRKFPRIRGDTWVNNVIVEDESDQKFFNTLYFSNQFESPQQPTYQDDPVGFLRYNRNVGEHVRETYNPELNDDYKDATCKAYLIFASLHDVLTDIRMFVRPIIE